MPSCDAEGGKGTQEFTIHDYWIHDLDPFALGTIAAKLRAQADHMDHQVRPALTTARADWAAHHRST